MRPTVRTIGLIGSSWISDGRPRCSLTLAGRFEDALDCFVKAERLSPRDPLLWGFTLIHALACILSHEYETAVHLAQKTIQIPRATGHWPHTVLAAPLAHLGRIEEARAAVKAALEQKPDLSLSYLKKTVPTKHPGGLDPYLDGLRKAGLPECRADFRFWLQADMKPPEIDFRSSPSFGHSGQSWE